MNENMSRVHIEKASELEAFHIDGAELFGKTALHDGNFVKDIGWLAGILCAEGGNANYLWFDQHELIVSYPSVVLKPINVEHIANFPIGAVYDSMLVHIMEPDSPDTAAYRAIPTTAIHVDDKGHMFVDPEYAPVGIAVACAVWKHVFPEEWEEVRSNYTNGAIKLSMESYSRSYSFRFGKGADAKVIELNDDNRHMLALVGREIDGERLYKIPREVTFKGVAKTQCPAEYRSRIIECASVAGALLEAQDAASLSSDVVGVDNLADIAAKWTSKYINDLPDMAFAYIESGGEKDGDGKTTPRSLRHFPHHTMEVKSATENSTVDLPHLRNALARAPQSPFGKNALGHLQKHAKALLKTKQSDKASETEIEVVWSMPNEFGVEVESAATAYEVYLTEQEVQPIEGNEQAVEPEIHSETSTHQERRDDMEEIQKAQERIQALEAELASAKQSLTQAEQARVDADKAKTAAEEALAQMTEKASELEQTLQAEHDAAARKERVESRVVTLKSSGILDDQSSQETIDGYISRVADMDQAAFDQLVQVEKDLIDRAAAKVKADMLRAQAKVLGLDESATEEQIATAQKELVDKASKGSELPPPPPPAVPDVPAVDTASIIEDPTLKTGFGTIKIVANSD